MAFTSEIKAVLGIDTSKMPADARKVIEQFKEAAKELENHGGKAGENAGEKFVHGLGHKLTNARHLSGALATALGLNIESIAEKIAAAIAGGSAEGWKKSVEIAEKNAEVIEKIIEAHMKPAQLEAKERKDLERALNENKESPVTATTAKRMAVTGALGIPGLDSMLAAIGIGQTQAEVAEERAKKTLKVNEADLKVVQSEQKTKEELQKLEEDSLAIKERHGTLAEKEQAIRASIKALTLSYVNDDLTAVELKKKENQLAERRLALEDNLKEQKKQKLELEKQDLAIQEKQKELVHQRRQLEKDEAKITDRGKLTIGELADLKSGTLEDVQRRQDEQRRMRAFSPTNNGDLSSDAVAAKEKAQRVKDLEEQADAARRGGDSAKSLDLLGQVGTLRDELVKSGFAKSTEGDPVKELKEQIAKDNEQILKTLNDIATTEKGKYTNQ